MALSSWELTLFQKTTYILQINIINIQKKENGYVLKTSVTDSVSHNFEFGPRSLWLLGSDINNTKTISQALIVFFLKLTFLLFYFKGLVCSNKFLDQISDN